MELEDDQHTAGLTKSKDLLEQEIKTLEQSEMRLRLVFENVNEATAIINGIKVDTKLKGNQTIKIINTQKIQLTECKNNLKYN